MKWKNHVFVRNKYIIKLFKPPKQSRIHYNTSSSKRIHPLLSCHSKIHWHICLLFFCVNSAWSISLLIQVRLFCSQRKNNIMYYKLEFEVKTILMISFLTSQDINWWTGVDYCYVFIICLVSLILTAPIHCRGSSGEQYLFWRKN